jgi:DegV family protein with EDD domain
MKKILIITDDNSGITHKEAKRLGIKIIRMPIIINGETYYQDETITSEKFYETLPTTEDIKTAAPIMGDLMNMWKENLNEYEEILFMPMSSGLTSSVNNAELLAKDFDGKVIVVDNHRISVTLKSAILDAIKLVEQGKTATEIKNILEEKGTSESFILIMVSTLKYLKRGGRITAAAALIGQTMHLKPILRINGGKLDAYATSLGFKRGALCMIDGMDKALATQFKDVPFDKIRFAIAYTEDLDAALRFREAIAKHLGIDKENIWLDPLSLSIGVHIGPGSLAIAFSKIVD